jgi:hypothetical protein
MNRACVRTLSAVRKGLIPNADAHTCRTTCPAKVPCTARPRACPAPNVAQRITPWRGLTSRLNIPTRVATGDRVRRAAGEGTAHGWTTYHAEVERGHTRDWTPIATREPSVGKGKPLHELAFECERCGSIPGIRQEAKRGVTHPRLLRVGYRFASPTTPRLPVGAEDNETTTFAGLPSNEGAAEKPRRPRNGRPVGPN